MEAMYHIEDLLCKELEDGFGRKQELNTGDLDLLWKLTDTIKNIEKICKMKKEKQQNYSQSGYSQSGYSRDGYSQDGYSQAGNWMAAMRGNYDRESSYSGDHSMSGRSMGGHSMEGRNPERTMREYLEGAMNEASSEQERVMIRRMMDKMRQAGQM